MNRVRALLSRRGARPAVGVLVVLLLGVLVLHLRAGVASKTVTAYFPKVLHIYKGSDVVVLGVRVGSVTKVVPQGDQVRVDLTYRASLKIPADAFAVIVEPTLVADRAVQLAPVYDSGPVLADHAVIPLARTEIPLELDDFNRNLSRLAVALGPTGANRDGSLSRAVTTGAANLAGEGAAAHRTLVEVSALSTTLDDNKAALFSTIRNLQAFTTTLAQHDAETRSFTTSLATVSAQLDAERQSLAAAVSGVGSALDAVASFVKNNRATLAKDVAALARVSQTLAKEKTLLAHIIDIGAVGVGNYPHMYTPSARTYNARFNKNGFDNPALFICQLYESVGGVPQQCIALLQPLNSVPLPPGATR